MSSFRADLHCHSTCSDGTLTPEQLVTLAVARGLSGLSITDHDCVDAYQLALPLAQEKNLLLLTGAEFSSNHQGHSVHILAYAFPCKNTAIQELCNRHSKRREERNQGILDLLRNKGMPIDPQTITALGSVGRPHIAQAMIESKYVKTIEEAFYKFLGDGKCCYVPGNPVSTEETIEIIHSAGGLAVIAHPHLIKNSAVVASLLELPFDGIECYYARFGPSDNSVWIDIAEKKRWIITGGSDFHGTVKPDISLGSSWVNAHTFNILYQKQTYVS